jgi:uncharacterized protein (DUF305 family)
LEILSPRFALLVVSFAVGVSQADASPTQENSQTAPPVVVQPGAPGEASKIVKPEAKAPPKFTEADVKFMQGMIGHHAQALEMVALRPGRSTSEDMRLLLLRIEVSQADEIKLMQRWLEDRGQPVPGPHAMHDHGAAPMPGMLSPEDMAKLAAAKGAQFERLFLEYMIKHHEGALVMVKELFNSPGAAQEAEVFAFASDVEADQLIEIRRMRGMLAAGR